LILEVAETPAGPEVVSVDRVRFMSSGSSMVWPNR
jgi:hypothetical protein